MTTILIISCGISIVMYIMMCAVMYGAAKERNRHAAVVDQMRKSINYSIDVIMRLNIELSKSRRPRDKHGRFLPVKPNVPTTPAAKTGTSLEINV